MGDGAPCWDNRMVRLLEQLSKLAEAGKRLGNVGSAPELYDVAFELIEDVFGHKTAAVLLMHPEHGYLSIAAARGYDPDVVKSFKAYPGEGITGWVAKNRQAQVITEIVGDARYIRGVPEAISEMAVPLISGNELIGVLDIESRSERFTSADLNLFGTFGEQVATAIRNLRLKASIETRAHKLAAIARAGQSLTQFNDTDILLTKILESTQEALDLTTCAIQLWDKDRENLIVKAAKGYDKDVIGLKIPRGQGITGKTAAQMAPHLVSDVTSTSDYIPGLDGCQSEMAVPLIFHDEVIGVLNTEHKLRDRFSQTDLLHATIFADQAAGAIGNAVLKQQLRKAEHEARWLRTRLDLLAATSQKLNMAENLDELLDDILVMARESLEFSHIAILLPELSGHNLRVHREHGYASGTAGKTIPVEGTITGEAFSSGKPVFVQDVRKDPRYISGSLNAQSEIAVPLRASKEVVGVLDVESTGEEILTESDRQVLEMLAAQVSAAVHSAQQREELAERNRRLTLIHKAACSLNTIDDPEKMLERILQLAQRALGIDSVAILTPDPQGTTLTVRKALHHGDVEGLRIPIGEGFVGKMYVSGEPGIIPDTRECADYIPGTKGARCEMATPVALGDEIIGILDAESPEPHAFSQKHLDLFRIFASQTATAFNNARMITELKARSSRLELLNRAASALSSILSPAEVLDEILDLATQALGLDGCAVLLFDKERRNLVVNAALDYGNVLGKSVPVKGSVTGHVAATGQPLLVADTASEERYVFGRQGGRCEMAVPLLVRGDVIGVLDSESPVPFAYDERDLDILSAFAAHAAVAIDNARLFEGLEEANDKLTANLSEIEKLNADLEQYAVEIVKANGDLEAQIKNLTTLHEAGRAIGASMDLDATLKAILEMTSSIIGSTAGAIKLIDAETKELKVRAMSGILSDISSSFAIFDLPLKVGDKTIGAFELVKKASTEIGVQERRMLETIASQAAIAIENARLFETTQKVYYETLKSLAKALEARDDYTRGHSERVADLAQSIGVELGLGTRELKAIYNAALLHDIGKIGIRDEVLLAPRLLSDEEMRIIRQHPTYGNAILMPLHFLGEIREFVRHHHERWDGSGYPDGRKGDEIPLASRIIAVADAYDAMTSDRPYRKALAKEIARDEIERTAGVHFDPAVIAAFLKVLEV